MQETLTELVVVSVAAGLVRGAAILNLNLVIAEHCCDDTLPAALGINMVIKGIVILTIGPFLGNNFFNITVQINI
jgi:MFS transporter, MCT family, solute carrier family 16 (monocarboxylic acid transporters), member 14